MTTEKGDKLFPDGVEGIKGFVYNDNIYIN
jgi:hypothetical protein